MFSTLFRSILKLFSVASVVFTSARSESTCRWPSGVSGICRSANNTFETAFNQNEITSCQRTSSCDVKCCPMRTLWNEDVGKCMIPENIGNNRSRFNRVANLRCPGRVHLLNNFDPNSKTIVVNGHKILTAFNMYDFCVDEAENSFGNATFIAFICQDEFIKLNTPQIVVSIICLICFIAHAIKISLKSLQDRHVDKFIFHHWSCLFLAMMILINEVKDSNMLVFFAIMACFSCIVVKAEKLPLLMAVAACVSTGFTIASIFLIDKIVFESKNIMTVVIYFLPMSIPLILGLFTFLGRRKMWATGNMAVGHEHSEWTVYFGLWICHLFFPFNVKFQMVFMCSPMIQTVFNFAFCFASHTIDRIPPTRVSTNSV